MAIDIATRRPEPEVTTDSRDALVATAVSKTFNTDHKTRRAVDAVSLRVAVQPGGCSGFRYALFFDDRQLVGDVEQSQHGITIRIDQMSSPYLTGAVIGWKESLEASGFSIDNPNSSGSCACGDSATF